MESIQTAVHSIIGETAPATPTTTVHGTETTQTTTVHTTVAETTTTTTINPAAVETTPTLTPTFDAGTLFGTNQEVASENPARQTGEETTGSLGPMTLQATTVSQTGTETSGTTTPVTTDGSKGSDTVSVDATGQQTSDPLVAVSHSPESTPTSNPPATESNPPASEPTAGPTPTQQPAAQSATNTTAAVENPVQPVEAKPLSVGPAAAGNLLAVLAYLFIGTPNGGPPLISLPSSLLSFLGFPFLGEVPTAPVVAGGIGGSLFPDGLLTATRAALTSPVSTHGNVLQTPAASDVTESLLSPTTGVERRTMSGVSAVGVEEERVSVGMADSGIPEQVRSVLRHTVGAVLAPLSLLVLAVMASPGLTGLILLAAAGTFFGYRQARAASMLRAVSVARFVKGGPLGVVRTGGLVAVHPRTSRAFSRRPDHASASLDTVA